ncbi:YkgJ family cysteine cluster protein [Oceanicoccus sagamiensis]|uniref:Zinc/iron-chelating domain-containing protein n=1 Tax=Oceanicoccus sagamiensis TaxID=716816 RepID=A0A1X9NH97_9GAMM|nr:YkgJ family cysteine cluster protein [Oceanicoccus sagamiensis]ARN75772.1 zinc/iron-chelating domain-containing protein [Oceanicoccus sagamiensis]
MKACNQCGKCCINYSDGGLTASSDDIAGWEVFNPEIARYVQAGQLWFSPETGQQLKRCPWLVQLDDMPRYGCSIYEDRPEDCRHYPVTIDDMIKDDCEMIEVKDLKHRQQAQRKLDQLMRDSRPPLGG